MTRRNRPFTMVFLDRKSQMVGMNGKWTDRVLHNFNNNRKDGASPSDLVLGADGNLYGTTGRGGTDGSGCQGAGCGTLFRLTSSANGRWTEEVLHNFNDKGKDGTSPDGGLMFDGAGNLYGTTFFGGAHGGGTVFEITP